MSPASTRRSRVVRSRHDGATRRAQAVGLGAVLVLALGACGGGGGGRDGAQRPTTTGATSVPTTVPTTVPSTTVPLAVPTPGNPCGAAGRAPDVYDHVVWIWMENKGLNDVIGNPEAPYENSLASQCAHATHYSGVSAPSLPNYLAAVSGSTWGIADDAPPSGHPIDADNLFRQVRATGRTARSYQEDMPHNCALDNSGLYGVRHNPATYFVGSSDRAACETDDVPLGSVGDGALRRDLDAGTLPAFSFVTPNVCNDTHDCTVRTGDDWLRGWLNVVLSSPVYAQGKTAVFVVWDEGDPIPFIAVAPAVPAGTVLDAAVDQYSLLRTTEEMLGISPHLGAAATAPSMRAGLGL